jgi:DNA-binding transcriptional regulator YhcF (GntR family)
MLDIAIDHDSSVPPFEQLRRRIVDLVRGGHLIAGSKLPTVRGLADTLGIAPNTVAKTYRELEKLGLLEAHGRAGTFVADTGDPARTRAQQITSGFVAEVRALGMSDAEIRSFVDAALRVS